MARGKYLSLEEARKSGKLDQFAKEQTIECEVPNPRERFDRFMELMAKAPAKSSKRGGKTSSRGDAAC